MTILTDRQWRIIFYLAWIIAGFCQAAVTELLSDEAYYWMYSQQPAWGYFDHPPVIACLIIPGFHLFQSELGVRFVPVLISALTIFCGERLVRPRNIPLFYIIVASIALLHFISFLAIPDNPLLLGTILFLLAYRKFNIAPGLLSALLLGCAMAFIILSKYHGILVIGLAILPNLKILRNWKFWVSGAIALFLLTPHILWQFHHQFPSITYQLFERSGDPYQISFTLNYIISQPFIFGPFMGLILLLACVKFRAGDNFERSMQWVVFGGYAFFFLATFIDRVEANWTVFVLAPSLYFGYHYIVRHDKLKTLVSRLFIPTIVLILLARVVIAFDIIPENNYTHWLHERFHKKEARAQAIANLPVTRPTLFLNSYQNASVYAFYTGEPTMSLNTIHSRKNQYDLWNLEEDFRGKTVYLVANRFYDGLAKDTIPGTDRPMEYRVIENFQPHPKVKVIVSGIPLTVAAGELFEISCQLDFSGTGAHQTAIAAAPPSFISYQFFRGNHIFLDVTTDTEITNGRHADRYKVHVKAPDMPGEIGIQISIKTGDLLSTRNSKRYTTHVTD